MKFIDSVEITVKSGDGGNGIVSYRREKHIPRGGPSGGNGGNGGDVIIIADDKINTLVDLKYKKDYKAGRGGDGGSNDKTGKQGNDLIIKVPIGTIITDVDAGLIIADLTEDKETFIAAHGGDGGRGNASFKTSTLQTPKFAEKGVPTDPRRIKLELKLLADVGLVGYPNVGKSTLISRISAATPKVADYPFTTLVPNLGVVRLGFEKSFVVADMPGLIEGAADGLGLGHMFLKHIERTRILIHLVDISPYSGRDCTEDFDSINKELQNYSEKIASLPQIIALNKCDLQESKELSSNVFDMLKKRGYEVFQISAVTGEGIEPLLYRVSDLLDSIPKTKTDIEEIKVFSIEKKGPKYQIFKEDGEFFVVGKEIENLIKRADLNNEYSLRRLTKQLESTGLFDDLRTEGCEHGDTVIILDFVFEFDDNF